LLQSLLECREAGLNPRSVRRGCAMEHTDAPHAVRLLGPRRDRPRRRPATDKD
jgi:hypothetical protein